MAKEPLLELNRAVDIEDICRRVCTIGDDELAAWFVEIARWARDRKAILFGENAFERFVEIAERWKRAALELQHRTRYADTLEHRIRGLEFELRQRFGATERAAPASSGPVVCCEGDYLD